MLLFSLLSQRHLNEREHGHKHTAPVKILKSLAELATEESLRPLLVDRPEQHVLLEERNLMLKARASRSHRFDLVKTAR